MQWNYDYIHYSTHLYLSNSPQSSHCKCYFCMCTICGLPVSNGHVSISPITYRSQYNFLKYSAAHIYQYVSLTKLNLTGLMEERGCVGSRLYCYYGYLIESMSMFKYQIFIYSQAMISCRYSVTFLLIIVAM